MFARARRFWNWWTGELSDIWRGRGPEPALVLAMGQEDIRLVERRSGASLGVATIGAMDWPEQIDALRESAESRVGRPAAVDVALPPDQTFVSEERFEPDEGNALRAAALLRVERLAQQSGQLLSFDLSPRVARAQDALTAQVAVSPEKTVREAAEYAARWGFRPVRVLAGAPWPEDSAAPCFYRDDSPDPTLKPFRRAAVGLIAVAAVGLAVGLWRAQAARSALADQAGAAAVASARDAKAIEGRAEAARGFAEEATHATIRRRGSAEVSTLVAAAAQALPPEAHADAIWWEKGRLRIQGRASTTLDMLKAIDSSPYFEGARFVETKAGGGGATSFTLEAAVTWNAR